MASLLIISLIKYSANKASDISWKDKGHSSGWRWWWWRLKHVQGQFIINELSSHQLYLYELGLYKSNLIYWRINPQVCSEIKTNERLGWIQLLMNKKIIRCCSCLKHIKTWCGPGLDMDHLLSFGLMSAHLDRCVLQLGGCSSDRQVS